jgi:y4mF family transcriptional regulator
MLEENTKNKQRLIYSLCCPFTDEVHYIGKSTTGMLRPLSHLHQSHSDKIKEWVNNLKELGHKPNIKIKEYVSINDDIDSRERYWIQYYLSNNSLLLNLNLISPLLINSKLDDLLDCTKKIEFKVGAFVKEKRKIHKLTQPELARKAGVGLRFLRDLEQGNKTHLRVDKVLDVLRLFGCTLEAVKIDKNK